mgnify:CR=1 FL=1
MSLNVTITNNMISGLKIDYSYNSILKVRSHNLEFYMKYAYLLVIYITRVQITLRTDILVSDFINRILNLLGGAG